MIDLFLAPFGAMAVISLVNDYCEGRNTGYKEALSTAFSRGPRFILMRIVYTAAVGVLYILGIIPEMCIRDRSDVKQDPDKLVEPTEVKKPNKDDYKAVAPKAPEEVKEPNEADYPNDSAGLYNAWQKYYSYKDKLKAYEKELAEYESGAAQKAKDEEYAEALAKYEEYVEAKKAYDEAKENQKDGADVALSLIHI